MGQGSPLVALVRGQLKSAHDALEGTMQGVTPELANWQPPGLAHSIAATYAHIVVAEDAILNGLTREEMTPLLAGDWASKTGLSSPPPMGGDWAEWARTVTVDLDALRAYGRAVFDESEAFVGELRDVDLNQPRDYSALGFGTQPIGWVFSILVANVQWHTGEIACLKGLRGVRGYPF